MDKESCYNVDDNDDHDDDDDPEKIPNLHLGFCLLVFIPTTLSMMMMMVKVS